MVSNLSQYIPLFYCFLSGLGFSLQGLCMKIQAEHGYHSSTQTIFYRGWFQLVMAAWYIYQGIDRKDIMDSSMFGSTVRARTLLFLRSVVGFVGILLAFETLARLPLGDATVLLMLSPLFASIGSYLLLGEEWLLSERMATVISLAGVVLVVKPTVIFGSPDSGTDTPVSVVGVILGLSGALVAGAVFIILRMLGTSSKMPWPNVCLVQGIGQILLAPPSLFITGEEFSFSPSSTQLNLMLIAAFIGTFSQVAMTIGMQREKSALAGAMRMSDVVFGFIWQKMLTDDEINLLSLLGAALIVSSILLVIVVKALQVKKITTSEKITSCDINSGGDDDVLRVDVELAPMDSHQTNKQQLQQTQKQHHTGGEMNLFRAASGRLARNINIVIVSARRRQWLPLTDNDSNSSNTVNGIPVESEQNDDDNDDDGSYLEEDRPLLNTVTTPTSMSTVI
eukprot:gene5893-11900_t